ncbi:MAG: DUF1819 family protein [Anaerolineae bacterium]|nr:DUF1819 family protein [Anaerolineae bacterium]
MSAYTSRVIKASALIADTKVLLAHWDLSRPVADNLEQARRQNIVGKTSRKRTEDVVRIFRQRYFDDPDVGAALVTLVQGGAPAQWIDPLLYFFAVQADRTLHDLVTEVLYPRQLIGYTDLPVDVVTRALDEWVAEGKTTTVWNEETTGRVAQGAMAALRDYGVLSGISRKQIAPMRLPLPAFALIALWLQQRERSGDRVLHSDEWRLFFLPPAIVERFFIEADQEHLLGYSAAGSVVRLDFPASTLVEYAHVLLERPRQEP